MNYIVTRTRAVALLVGIALVALSGLAAAEPPLRAARLSFISGTVIFSPAGQSEWVRAVVNRPLTSGDRLWVDAGSRAELQVGGAAIRLGPSTSLVLSNLDDRIAQLELDRGTLKVRVRRMGANQAFEVNTPNLAVSMRRAGEYRIDSDPNEDATSVAVQSGRAELYGERGSYAVAAGQGYRFYGTSLNDYDRLAKYRDDDLDRWARERDRRIETSRSARYVSPDVVGYEELDAYGTWGTDQDYGNVWRPSRVASGWTPYRDGHWSWVDPWGWTWVDDAPWGYAVSHYGRWANLRGSWVWVPGPQREQAVYAPALVGFVDGRNLQLASAVGTAIAAAIGWFPLAPKEVYRPSYPVSRGYFDRVNRSNTVVAPATITNIYNTTIVNRTTNVTNVTYANQRVPGALIAVPAQAFVQSQPVAKAAVPVAKEAAVAAPVAAVAAVAPVQQSVQGSGAPVAGTRPPGRQRNVIARTAPPPAPPAFAAQQSQLAATPGVPIDPAKRAQLQPAASAAPAVVTAAQAPAPTAAPPATAPGARSGDARRADAGRRDGARPEAARADPEAAKVEAAKADAAKADAAKADAAKADAAKAAASKGDAMKAEAARLPAPRATSRAAKAEGAGLAKAKQEPLMPPLQKPPRRRARKPKPQKSKRPRQTRRKSKLRKPQQPGPKQRRSKPRERRLRKPTPRRRPLPRRKPPRRRQRKRSPPGPKPPKPKLPRPTPQKPKAMQRAPKPRNRKL